MFSKIKIFYLFYLFSFISFLFSSDIKITASVSSSDVALGEEVYYYVNVEGGSSSNYPEIKKIDNVDIYRVGSSSQISLINGHMTSSNKFTYILTPKEEGKIFIPPATIKVNRRTYSSNSVSINVSKNSRNNINLQNSTATNTKKDESLNSMSNTSKKTAKNLFITSSVSKKVVYINEPFVLTFKVFTRVRFLSSPIFIMGETNGFWKEDLNVDKSYNETYDGEEYNVIEKKYILYPTSPGDLLISPSTLSCNIEDIVDSDNFFGISFFSRGRKVELKTNSIKIKVKDFPIDGRPENFDGSIGNFTLDTKIVEGKHKIGEPINVDIIIKGIGNINSISSPRLYNVDNYKIYDPIEKIDLEKTDKGLRGTKKFQVMMIPLVYGQQKLPKLEFSFFNYKSNKYVVLEKDLGELYIEKSENSSLDNDRHDFSNEKISKSELKLLNGDIRFIHRNTKLKLRNKNENVFSIFFWIVLIFPALIYFIILFFEKFNIFNFLKGKDGFSLSIFNKKINKIKKEIQKKSDKDFLDEKLNEILDIFLEFIKYKFPHLKLKTNLSTFGDLLDKDFSIPDYIKKDIKDFLDFIYYNKFASSSLSYDSFISIIEKLEKLKQKIYKL